VVRKVFRAGNSLVVSLPRETIRSLGLKEGSKVSVAVNEEDKQIIIEPIPLELDGVDEEFARQVADFITLYRPALEALAKK
jgi:antitoxin MazE